LRRHQKRWEKAQGDYEPIPDEMRARRQALWVEKCQQVAKEREWDRQMCEKVWVTIQLEEENMT
jgi:hypothetical protein